MTLILVIFIHILITASRLIHFSELNNLNFMIFCNLRSTEPVLVLHARQVFTERRPLSNCHGKENHKDIDLSGVDSETLILPNIVANPDGMPRSHHPPPPLRNPYMDPPRLVYKGHAYGKWLSVFDRFFLRWTRLWA